MPTPKDKKPAPKAKAKAASKRSVAKVAEPDPRETAMGKCVAFGVENLVDQILAGNTLTGISTIIGVSLPTLIRWIASDAAVAERSREARLAAVRTWDERAEELVATARDPFQLAKAKELAHHYRWRSSCIAPADYNPNRGGTTPSEPIDQTALLSQIADQLPN
jgi:hypothetical protein